jgi:hypothetical protein
VDVTCRTAEGEPDVALGLLDLSAAGAQLLVRGIIPAGQAVEVCLYPTGSPAGFCLSGQVLWSAPMSGSYSSARIQFDERLSAGAYRALCRPEAALDAGAGSLTPTTA